jgi:hypothetical protein
MTRIILALVLAVLGGTAMAAWVRVGGNNDISGIYADPASIRKAGSVVRMRSLIDFRHPQTDQSIQRQAYLSETDQREYDCKAERYRLLRFSLRSGQMDAGNIVRSSPSSRDWSPVVPGSLGEALWKFACSKGPDSR